MASCTTGPPSADASDAAEGGLDGSGVLFTDVHLALYGTGLRPGPPVNRPAPTKSHLENRPPKMSIFCVRAHHERCGGDVGLEVVPLLIARYELRQRPARMSERHESREYERATAPMCLRFL